MDNTQEQEINLKDLLFYILHKWRLVILCAFVLVFLVGGYKLGKAMLHQRDKAYITEQQEKYEQNMLEYQQTKEGYESTINNLTANIEYEEKYEKNSVLFKMDPYNKWVATVDFFIKMSEDNDGRIITVDPADSIVKAYASSIKKGDYLNDLSKKIGIKESYLKELISVGADNDGNMTTVSIAFEDKEGAQEILNAVLEHLNAMYSEVNTRLGDHNIIIMNQNVAAKVDQDLADSQKSRADNLSDMHIKVEEAQKLMDELQKPQEPASLSVKGEVKSVIKYSILGGMIGAFLIVFFYCVVYILNSRLYSSEILKSRYGIKILGAFMPKRKKRSFSGIDSLLDKLEGKEYICEETVYQRIIANISNNTESGQNILLTGTVEEETLRGFLDKLEEMLPELHFEIGIDMNKNPETLTKLLKVDGMILIEKCGLSKYNDIQEELEAIYNLNQKVIGSIVL